MRATPFDLWTSMWSSTFALAKSGVLFSEMMRASARVVQVRSRALAAATHNPLDADYVEFGRMVTEKVEAFSEAGASALEDVRGIQADALGQWQQIMGLASGARPLTGREAGSLLARQTRMMERAANAGGKMMTPIHRRATANAKRLGKRR